MLHHISENDLITLPPGYCILEILAFFIQIFISIMPGSHLGFYRGYKSNESLQNIFSL